MRPTRSQRIAPGNAGRAGAARRAEAAIAAGFGPARSYIGAMRESKARHAELSRLEAEHARLAARKRALGDPAVLEREARRLGYVKLGERSYVIRDLPK